MKTPRTRGARAQGITEYVVIIGLIALVLTAAVSFFGDSVEAAYEKSTGALVTKVNGEQLPLPPKTPGNPYEWNRVAGRWYNPADRNHFVSKSMVARYEADPDRYEGL